VASKIQEENRATENPWEANGKVERQHQKTGVYKQKGKRGQLHGKVRTKRTSELLPTRGQGKKKRYLNPQRSPELTSRQGETTPKAGKLQLLLTSNILYSEKVYQRNTATGGAANTLQREGDGQLQHDKVENALEQCTKRGWRRPTLSHWKTILRLPHSPSENT